MCGMVAMGDKGPLGIRAPDSELLTGLRARPPGKALRKIHPRPHYQTDGSAAIDPVPSPPCPATACCMAHLPRKAQPLRATTTAAEAAAAAAAVARRGGGIERSRCTPSGSHQGGAGRHRHRRHRLHPVALRCGRQVTSLAGRRWCGGGGASARQPPASLGCCGSAGSLAGWRHGPSTARDAIREWARTCHRWRGPASPLPPPPVRCRPGAFLLPRTERRPRRREEAPRSPPACRTGFHAAAADTDVAYHCRRRARHH